MDESDLVRRRSDRKRRKVYETLNVKMLTDHRYLTGFENSKSPKKKDERKRYLMDEESDSQTEGDEVQKFKYCVVLFEIGAIFVLFGANHRKHNSRYFNNNLCLPDNCLSILLVELTCYVTNNNYNYVKFNFMKYLSRNFMPEFHEK